MKSVRNTLGKKVVGVNYSFPIPQLEAESQTRRQKIQPSVCDNLKMEGEVLQKNKCYSKGKG